MKAKIWHDRWWVTETDPKRLKNIYKKHLKQSGFTVVGFVDNHFTPQGYSAVFLLAESHLAIHTFPEENKTYIELSSCTEEFFDKFIGSQNFDPDAPKS